MLSPLLEYAWLRGLHGASLGDALRDGVSAYFRVVGLRIALLVPTVVLFALWLVCVAFAHLTTRSLSVRTHDLVVIAAVAGAIPLFAVRRVLHDASHAALASGRHSIGEALSCGVRRLGPVALVLALFFATAGLACALIGLWYGTLLDAVLFAGLAAQLGAFARAVTRSIWLGALVPESAPA